MKTSSRKHILNLMCEFETSWTDASTYLKKYPPSYPAERNGKRRTITDGQQQSAGHGKW
jgi:hypothetical protein